MFESLRPLKRILPRSAALLAAAAMLYGGAAQAQEATATLDASSRSMAAGTPVVATLSARAPMMGAEQMAAFRAAFDRSHRGGPTNLPRAAPAAVGSAGPPVPLNTAAATDFFLFDNIVAPGGGLTSPVGEPSGETAGANVFQTGNWYATASFDGGVTWNYEDPFSLFGGGFCCDQVVVYDPGRNWWFWLLQYTDGHLVLANSGDLVNWCSYAWTPASFGFTGELDYNDLALTTNNIYIVSNVFPSTGGMGSTIARLPIDAQVSCTNFNYNFFTRTDLGFTWKPVSGAYDVLYWGTNWFGTLGSSFRVFKWPENTGTISWFDRTLSTTFPFYTRGSGQNCASTDGVVKNWCQFADSRVLGGARYTDPNGGAQLVFSFNAKQGGPFNLPKPYTERVYFDESTIAYLASDRIWNPSVAFQFTSLATDARGHIGMTTTFGGDGTYPSLAVFLNDDVAPSQPWDNMVDAFGQGNACNSGLFRWGDYLTTRPVRPTNTAFWGLGYILTSDAGACNVDTPQVELHQAKFGRSRDIPGALQRWF